MQIEQVEILNFLKRFSPFKELPDDLLQHTAMQVDIGYFKAGTPILRFGEPLQALHLVRSGAVETYRRNGVLYNRLSEGGIFAEQGLLRDKSVIFPATAIEDCLIYFIPVDCFELLYQSDEVFADYVEIGDTQRKKGGVLADKSNNDLMSSEVRQLIGRTAVTLVVDATVQQAAQLMQQESVSCLLIVADQSTNAALVGIVTDRDLRNRLIAAGLDYQQKVAVVMTTDLVCIEQHQFVFEAMLLMLRHNVHHLPVLEEGKVLGIISIADVIRYESQNSLYIVSSIFRQQTVAELQSLSTELASCFVRMVNEDANSRMIGAAMAVTGRSFKQRLLELAELQLGPPPVPYCFLALGSMARDEQLIVTDQDNALVLHNDYDPVLHQDYFAALAQFVCDGLAACGYSYCSGDIMATNSQWRQPLRVWQQYFTDWIEKPDAQRLLNSGIFFDLEGVWGQVRWADQLNQQIRRQVKANPDFLACMARNAISRTPPLGFFKDFVLENDGQQNNSLDIKRRGTAPLADLVRVHALSIGCAATNTYERLLAVKAAGILPKGRADDLLDALEVIAMVRIRQQAKAIQAGRAADNKVKPEELSAFERKTLKEAFQILSFAQKFLKFRYPGGRQ